MKNIKVYTKKGDRGKTSLLGKSDVYKSDSLIEAYGTVDELNSMLGICINKIQNPVIKKDILQIQKNLFLIGSYLADYNKQFIKKEDINKLKLQTEILEKRIDEMEKQLPTLLNFILPGGTETAAFIHLARCVTRRAERNIVKIHKKTVIDKNVLSYINRLSDYFFVLARFLNKKAKITDVIWKI